MKDDPYYRLVMARPIPMRLARDVLQAPRPVGLPMSRPSIEKAHLRHVLLLSDRARVKST